MGALEVLNRLEELLAGLEELPEPSRSRVFEFLDGLEALHREAVHALGDELDGADLARAAAARPEISWLLMAYGVPVDQRPEAEEALRSLRREVAAAGGTLEVLEAREGVVRVRVGGGSSGASPETLERSIEAALAGHMPSFSRLEVEHGAADSSGPATGVPLPMHRPPTSGGGP